MNRVFCLPIALVLASAAHAQTQNIVWHGDSAPNAGSANTFPWSQNGIRYQTLILGTQLGNKPCRVNDLFVAPQRSMTPKVRTAIYHDIEVRMGLTDTATLVTNWDTNNPKPTMVYRGPLRVTFEADAWRGFGLPVPYDYIPVGNLVNLCVEFILWSADAPSISGVRALTGTAPAIQRAYYFQWVTAQTTPPSVGTGGAKIGLLCNDGNFVVTGDGCTSSANTPLAVSASTWPISNKTIDVQLSGGAPSTVAGLMLGFSFTAWGPLTLPFDLGAGAPGCLLWNDPTLILPAAVDQNGAAQVTLGPIPPSFNGGRAYVSWLNIDPKANTLGLTTSSLGRLLFGQ